MKDIFGLKRGLLDDLELKNTRVVVLGLQIRNSWKYKQWRVKILKRDRHICQICKEMIGTEVDHYPVSFSEILSKNNITTIGEAYACFELWDTDGGRTVCSPCHRGTESYGVH